jgi:tape measure domain-containing protein
MSIRETVELKVIVTPEFSRLTSLEQKLSAGMNVKVNLDTEAASAKWESLRTNLAQGISPKIDVNSLHNLNSVIDLKLRHWGILKAELERGIVPKIDTSKLSSTPINIPVSIDASSLQRELRVLKQAAILDVKIKQDVNVHLRGETSNALYNAMRKALESQKANPLEKLIGLATSPFRVAADEFSRSAARQFYKGTGFGQGAQSAGRVVGDVSGTVAKSYGDAVAKKLFDLKDFDALIGKLNIAAYAFEKAASFESVAPKFNKAQKDSAKYFKEILKGNGVMSAAGLAAEDFGDSLNKLYQKLKLASDPKEVISVVTQSKTDGDKLPGFALDELNKILVANQEKEIQKGADNYKKQVQTAVRKYDKELAIAIAKPLADVMQSSMTIASARLAQTALRPVRLAGMQLAYEDALDNLSSLTAFMNDAEKELSEQGLKTIFASGFDDGEQGWQKMIAAMIPQSQIITPKPNALYGEGQGIQGQRPTDAVSTVLSKIFSTTGEAFSSDNVATERISNALFGYNKTLVTYLAVFARLLEMQGGKADNIQGVGYSIGSESMRQLSEALRALGLPEIQTAGLGYSSLGTIITPQANLGNNRTIVQDTDGFGENLYRLSMFVNNALREISSERIVEGRVVKGESFGPKGHALQSYAANPKVLEELSKHLKGVLPAGVVEGMTQKDLATALSHLAASVTAPFTHLASAISKDSGVLPLPLGDRREDLQQSGSFYLNELVSDIEDLYLVLKKHNQELTAKISENPATDLREVAKQMNEQDYDEMLKKSTPALGRAGFAPQDESVTSTLRAIAAFMHSVDLLEVAFDALDSTTKLTDKQIEGISQTFTAFNDSTNGAYYGLQQIVSILGDLEVGWISQSEAKQQLKKFTAIDEVSYINTQGRGEGTLRTQVTSEASINRLIYALDKHGQAFLTTVARAGTRSGSLPLPVQTSGIVPQTINDGSKQLQLEFPAQANTKLTSLKEKISQRFNLSLEQMGEMSISELVALTKETSAATTNQLDRIVDTVQLATTGVETVLQAIENAIVPKSEILQQIKQKGVADISNAREAATNFVTGNKERKATTFLTKEAVNMLKSSLNEADFAALLKQTGGMGNLSKLVASYVISQAEAAGISVEQLAKNFKATKQGNSSEASSAIVTASSGLASFANALTKGGKAVEQFVSQLALAQSQVNTKAAAQAYAGLTRLTQEIIEPTSRVDRTKNKIATASASSLGDMMTEDARSGEALLSKAELRKVANFLGISERQLREMKLSSKQAITSYLMNQVEAGTQSLPNIKGAIENVVGQTEAKKQGGNASTQKNLRDEVARIRSLATQSVKTFQELVNVNSVGLGEKGSSSNLDAALAQLLITQKRVQDLRRAPEISSSQAKTLAGLQGYLEQQIKSVPQGKERAETTLAAATQESSTTTLKGADDVSSALAHLGNEANRIADELSEHHYEGELFAFDKMGASHEGKAQDGVKPIVPGSTLHELIAPIKALVAQETGVPTWYLNSVQSTQKQYSSPFAVGSFTEDTHSVNIAEPKAIAAKYGIMVDDFITLLGHELFHSTQAFAEQMGISLPEQIPSPEKAESILRSAKASTDAARISDPTEYAKVLELERQAYTFEKAFYEKYSSQLSQMFGKHGSPEEKFAIRESSASLAQLKLDSQVKAISGQKLGTEDIVAAYSRVINAMEGVKNPSKEFVEDIQGMMRAIGSMHPEAQKGAALFKGFQKEMFSYSVDDDAPTPQGKEGENTGGTLLSFLDVIENTSTHTNESIVKAFAQVVAELSGIPKNSLDDLRVVNLHSGNASGSFNPSTEDFSKSALELRNSSLLHFKYALSALDSVVETLAHELRHAAQHYAISRGEAFPWVDKKSADIPRLIHAAEGSMVHAAGNEDEATSKKRFQMELDAYNFGANFVEKFIGLIETSVKSKQQKDVQEGMSDATSAASLGKRKEIALIGEYKRIKEPSEAERYSYWDSIEENFLETINNIDAASRKITVGSKSVVQDLNHILEGFLESSIADSYTKRHFENTSKDTVFAHLKNTESREMFSIESPHAPSARALGEKAGAKAMESVGALAAKNIALGMLGQDDALNDALWLLLKQAEERAESFSLAGTGEALAKQIAEGMKAGLGDINALEGLQADINAEISNARQLGQIFANSFDTEALGMVDSELKTIINDYLALDAAIKTRGGKSNEILTPARSEIVGNKARILGTSKESPEGHINNARMAGEGVASAMENAGKRATVFGQNIQALEEPFHQLINVAQAFAGPVMGQVLYGAEALLNNLGILKIAGQSAFVAIGIGVAVYSIAQLGVAQEMLALRLQFDSLGKSGKDNLEKIGKVAQRTGSDFRETAKLAAAIQGGLISTPLEGDALAITEKITKINQAMQLSPEIAQRFETAMTQMFAKGVVSMEELRQQAAEAVPAIIPAFASSQNLSVGQLTAKVSAGEVSSYEAVPKALDALVKMSSGAYEEGLKSLPASMNRINNSILSVNAAFGKLPLDMIAGLTYQIANLVESLTPAAKALAPFAGALTAIGLIQLGGFIARMGIVSGGIGLLTKGLKAFYATSAQGLTQPLNNVIPNALALRKPASQAQWDIRSVPVGLIAAVAALTAGFIELGVNATKSSKAGEEGLKKIFEGAKKAKDALDEVSIEADTTFGKVIDSVFINPLNGIVEMAQNARKELERLTNFNIPTESPQVQQGLGFVQNFMPPQLRGIFEAGKLALGEDKPLTTNAEIDQQKRNKDYLESGSAVVEGIKKQRSENINSLSTFVQQYDALDAQIGKNNGELLTLSSSSDYASTNRKNQLLAENRGLEGQKGTTLKGVFGGAESVEEAKAEIEKLKTLKKELSGEARTKISVDIINLQQQIDLVEKAFKQEPFKINLAVEAGKNLDDSQFLEKKYNAKLSSIAKQRARFAITSEEQGLLEAKTEKINANEKLKNLSAYSAKRLALLEQDKSASAVKSLLGVKEFSEVTNEGLGKAVAQSEIDPAFTKYKPQLELLQQLKQAEVERSSATLEASRAAQKAVEANLAYLNSLKNVLNVIEKINAANEASTFNFERFKLAAQTSVSQSAVNASSSVAQADRTSQLIAPELLQKEIEKNTEEIARSTEAYSTLSGEQQKFVQALTGGSVGSLDIEGVTKALAEFKQAANLGKPVTAGGLTGDADVQSALEERKKQLTLEQTTKGLTLQKLDAQKANIVEVTEAQIRQMKESLVSFNESVRDYFVRLSTTLEDLQVDIVSLDMSTAGLNIKNEMRKSMLGMTESLDRQVFQVILDTINSINDILNEGSLRQNQRAMDDLMQSHSTQMRQFNNSILDQKDAQNDLLKIPQKAVRLGTDQYGVDNTEQKQKALDSALGASPSVGALFAAPTKSITDAMQVSANLLAQGNERLKVPSVPYQGQGRLPAPPSGSFLPVENVKPQVREMSAIFVNTALRWNATQTDILRKEYEMINARGAMGKRTNEEMARAASIYSSFVAGNTGRNKNAAAIKEFSAATGRNFELAPYNNGKGDSSAISADSYAREGFDAAGKASTVKLSDGELTQKAEKGLGEFLGKFGYSLDSGLSKLSYNVDGKAKQVLAAYREKAVALTANSVARIIDKLYDGLEGIKGIADKALQVNQSLRNAGRSIEQSLISLSQMFSTLNPSQEAAAKQRQIEDAYLSVTDSIDNQEETLNKSKNFSTKGQFQGEITRLEALDTSKLPEAEKQAIKRVTNALKDAILDWDDDEGLTGKKRKALNDTISSELALTTARRDGAKVSKDAALANAADSTRREQNSKNASVVGTFGSLIQSAAQSAPISNLDKSRIDAVVAYNTAIVQAKVDLDSFTEQLRASGDLGKASGDKLLRSFEGLQAIKLTGLKDQLKVIQKQMKDTFSGTFSTGLNSVLDGLMEGNLNLGQIGLTMAKSILKGMAAPGIDIISNSLSNFFTTGKFKRKGQNTDSFKDSIGSLTGARKQYAPVMNVDAQRVFINGKGLGESLGTNADLGLSAESLGLGGDFTGGIFGGFTGAGGDAGNYSASSSVLGEILPSITGQFDILGNAMGSLQGIFPGLLDGFGGLLSTLPQLLSSLLSSGSGGGGGILGGLLGGGASTGFSFTSLLGFANGGTAIPNFANGTIKDALATEAAQSGKRPFLAALHEGEEVMSTKNGDADTIRRLKNSGAWSLIKQNKGNFAEGGTVTSAGAYLSSTGSIRNQTSNNLNSSATFVLPANADVPSIQRSLPQLASAQAAAQARASRGQTNA